MAHLKKKKKKLIDLSAVFSFYQRGLRSPIQLFKSRLKGRAF